MTKLLEKEAKFK
jgi:hypothetical protein